MLRTTVSLLEDRTGTELRIASGVMSWAVCWAVMLGNRVKYNHEGVTPCHKDKGRPWRLESVRRKGAAHAEARKGQYASHDKKACD